MTRALGYCRVSTDQQGESGAGLSAQRSTITAEVQRRDWELVAMLEDVASGKSTKKRPALEKAVAMLRDGEADVLIVAKLDRLSRSLADFANITAQSREEGWSIVAIDIGVDTSTINGELVAAIIMALAQWERRIIGQRTKEALAVRSSEGVKLGRPTVIRDEAVGIIVQMRSEGASYRRIARLLTEAGIPTPQRAASWSPSTVKLLWDRHRA